MALGRDFGASDCRLDLYASKRAGSIGITRPHGLQLDLGMVGEPEDVWARLFLAWLKHLGEQNAINQERLAVMENAITELDKAVAKLLPEESKDLRAAVKSMQELHGHWEEQSSKGLRRVEEIAVLIKGIVAQQKSE